MAGGVNLLTNVIIGGQTTAGFNALAGKIQSLGAQVDRIGSAVREFEKDSAQVYRNYEDNMLAAEYALSAQYTDVNDLSKVMKGLDEYAQDWAASTIFHTDDVSKAIDEAAHAGWNYEKIIEGIPQAMYIAQAGGMDLSTGLDYLVKIMGSTGSEFDDMGTVIDQWSKSANMSATTIDEMGEAFMSMGAAAQFGDSTAELFTLLAILADVGTTGTRAGTQLRNSMMRIIAPTTKAEDAMSLLGADMDEINEVLADTNVTKAAKMLEGLGFSAYDSEGKLLPMIQIYKNLYDALDGLEEQAQNEILAAIFPTRTIAAARAFMDAVGNGKMERLFESISDSEGYAKKGADIMMSGMTGAVETLLSKWEEFKRGFGEMMAPTIEKVADYLGGLVDKLNDLDPEVLAGLGSMLTMLAAAGPILMGVGGLMKLMAVLGPVGSLAMGAGLGIAFLIGWEQKLKETEFKGNFGQLELDIDTLGSHVDGLKTKFDKQQEAIKQWESALEKAEQDYANSSSKLSETLLMDVLTGKELTGEDKNAIYAYAGDIYKAVNEGLAQAKASDLTFLQALFGDRNTEDEEVAYNMAANVVDAYYGSLYQEAYDIGNELRTQMTKALEGDLNEQERKAIMDTIERYNEIMAQISAAQDKEAYYAQLHQAQSVSWDSVAEYIEENTSKQEADLRKNKQTYSEYYARYRAAFEFAAENGLEFEDLYGNKKIVTMGDWTEYERIFYEKEAEAEADIVKKYGDLSAVAINSLLDSSKLSVGWNYVKWMQQSGFDLDAVDVDKLINQESYSTIMALVDALSDVSNADVNKIIGTLKPFADNEQVAEYISMLELLPDLRNAVAGYSRENQEEIDAQIRYIESLKKDNKPQQDIEAAEAHLKELQGENPTLTVETEVDDTAVKEYDAGTKTLRIIPFLLGKTYAEGGRATEPSIFGEVPGQAEWAIPEEHSERTAALLNEARQASGFTWGDLISRFGGLNANPSHKKVVVNYSPTINAGNAEGVAEVLQQDKSRLLKMVKGLLDDIAVREEVEAYA